MSQDILVVVEHLQGKVSDITYIMLAAARRLSGMVGGHVLAVLLGHQAEPLAGTLSADRVIYVDHPALSEFSGDAYQVTLAEVIGDRNPRAVLFGNTTIGSDVAGVLSIRLKAPLVSSVMQIGENGCLVSQVCGGKIFTEVALPEEPVLVTMVPGGFRVEEGQASDAPEIVSFPAPALEDVRVVFNAFLEREDADVDISQSSVLISVGRGIQNEGNIELAEELAELLGGELSATRPIVDQGWLPTSRMVGKSGLRVNPKMYLALGVSGAPEHLEGIAAPESIVAINTDPQAPIFSVARYGIQMDLFDLIDPLIEKLEEAKG